MKYTSTGFRKVWSEEDDDAGFPRPWSKANDLTPEPPGRRTMEDLRKGMKGSVRWYPKNTYPYEFTKKSKVLGKLYPHCQYPGCLSEDGVMTHHIDKNPMNNEWDNLIRLCFEHHEAHHPNLRVPPWMRKPIKHG